MNYNYKTLVEASGSIPGYGYYTFLAGKNLNTVDVLDKASNLAFDGNWKDSTLQGLAVMRKVQYQQTFRFDQLNADDSKQLDFIVAFSK